MTYLEKISDLYQQMANGQMMEAFEQYYHESVVVKEPTGETRNGKDAQRKAIHQWQANIKEFHGGGHDSITANEQEGITMVRSWTDVTFQDGRRMSLSEIAHQKWENDQIVEESFYYFVPNQ
ncbi:MAG: nuclear transport factor 2 family protein [Bacteroidota bacterium]